MPSAATWCYGWIPRSSHAEVPAPVGHLLWLVPFVVGLAALRWPKLQGIALLTILVCGVTGVARLVRRAKRTGEPNAPLGAEEKRDYYSVQKDIPPSPG